MCGFQCEIVLSRFSLDNGAFNWGRVKEKKILVQYPWMQVPQIRRGGSFKFISFTLHSVLLIEGCGQVGSPISIQASFPLSLLVSFHSSSLGYYLIVFHVSWHWRLWLKVYLSSDITRGRFTRYRAVSQLLIGCCLNFPAVHWVPNVLQN